MSTQVGRGMILPARQVHDAGELTRSPARSVMVVPPASHRPWVPEPLRNGRGDQMRPCRHGLRRDHTVFHVVASGRANPAMVAPSKRNCRITQRIAQRIARVPRRARGAHTEWFHSMKVTIRQLRSRHIQRRIVPPEPHRNTGPRHVDHLHHHTPVTVSKSPHNPSEPAQRSQDSMSSIRPHSRQATETR